MPSDSRRTRIGLLSIGLLLLAGSGCRSPQVDVHVPAARPVEISVHPSARRAQRVDEHDPRLQKAIEATEALLGHPVAFEFDLELAPRDDGWFLERMFDSEVGRIPRELRDLADKHPEVFAHARDRIRRITFKYDGSAPNNGATFDPKTGLVFYELPSAYLGRGSLTTVLRSHYLDAYDQSFDNRAPRDIRDDELLAYTKWIGDRRRIPKEDVLYRASQYLEVYQRIAKNRRSHTAVMEVLHDKIPRQASYLADQFRNRAEDRDSSPLLDRVSRAYGRFIKSEFDRLPQTRKAAVLAWLFPRRTDVTTRASDRFIRDAYPGFDRLAFGFRIAKRWLAAGAPDRLDQKELTQLICPRGTVTRPVASPHCRSHDTVWAFAVYDAKERRRVAAALRKSNDTRLTFAVLTAMHDAYPEGMKDVWRQLEGNKAQWQVGAAIVAEP